MKVLHVHKYFHERDGAGRYMFSLMRAFTARGHATAAFAMHDPRNRPSPWDKYFVSALDTTHAGHGVSALRQLGRALWSREAEKKMDGMLAAFQPDIVHVHNLYTHLSPSVLAPCRARGIPLVMTVHDYALASANYALWAGDHPLHAGKNGFLDVVRTRFMKGSMLATGAAEAITRLHRALRLYDRVVTRYIVLSTFVKDVMVAVGYDAEKIVVVPPGIDRPASVTHGAHDQVLYIGRLAPYKGAHVFIDALRLCPGVRARVVGDGPDRAMLEKRAVGIAHVRFDGFLSGEALWDAYASARVLVVPSLWYEPFGLVVLEAMARGIPVIVSDRGGLPELVKDGGVVVPAGDYAALAAAIRRFTEDPSYAEKMGERAILRAGYFGGPDAHFSRIKAVYDASG